MTDITTLRISHEFTPQRASETPRRLWRGLCALLRGTRAVTPRGPLLRDAGLDETPAPKRLSEAETHKLRHMTLL